MAPQLLCSCDRYLLAVFLQKRDYPAQTHSAFANLYRLLP
jgi:hypothetical protein